MKKTPPISTEQEKQKQYRMLIRDLARNPDQIQFPESITAELAKISETISNSEILKRRDFRSVMTVTIDPDDAKDFDDALSVEFLPDGTTEVGIHIADVGHYVTQGTTLDTEAFERGTSIYLARSVVPMLPERLSNDLCSLVEGTPRLTFSVTVIFDKNYKIKSTWMGKGVILSDKRLTYSQAQKILDTNTGTYARELTLLKNISDKLYKRRVDNGALLLEDTEIRFTYDAEGNPVGVSRKTRLDTHKLIEEFMLLANTLVAQKFTKKDTFVYRIHDTPDTEKLAVLRERALEYNMVLPKKIDNQTLNAFLQSIVDEDVRDLFSKLVMRSMAKAIYSSKNIGHYGLAFPQYTHFTSPIRRYPDIIAHRLLLLKLSSKKVDIDPRQFEQDLVFLSLCERRATDMERASQKDMQIRYMATRIGETRTGVVSGLNEFGVYVSDKESLSEGFISQKSLGNTWKWNERGSFWKSDIAGKIKVGEHVLFTVEKVNFEKGFIDYSLCKKK